MLHAVEKPMNLDYAQPFSNTDDLKDFTPKIDENLAKAKELEREEELKKKLSKETDEKADETTIDLDEFDFKLKGNKKSKT